MNGNKERKIREKRKEVLLQAGRRAEARQGEVSTQIEQRKGKEEARSILTYPLFREKGLIEILLLEDLL